MRQQAIPAAPRNKERQLLTADPSRVSRSHAKTLNNKQYKELGTIALNS